MLPQSPNTARRILLSRGGAEYASSSISSSISSSSSSSAGKACGSSLGRLSLSNLLLILLLTSMATLSLVDHGVVPKMEDMAMLRTTSTTTTTTTTATPNRVSTENVVVPVKDDDDEQPMVHQEDTATSLGVFDRLAQNYNHNVKQSQSKPPLQLPKLDLTLRRQIDFEQYTVRINTWKRQEQLRIVVTHVLTCPSVAQVQIVWCSAQGPVPAWLHELAATVNQEVKTDDYVNDDDDNNHDDPREEGDEDETSDKPQEDDDDDDDDYVESLAASSFSASSSPMSWPRLVIEEHEDNSLNARFHVQTPPPTVGILNQDDDILRPCQAMDAGFALWTMNPDRLVGFDARRITFLKEPAAMTIRDGDEEEEEEEHAMLAVDDPSSSSSLSSSSSASDEYWGYGGVTETNKANDYSLVLTRFAFCHVNYLHSYTHDMPAIVRRFIARNLNCEDIAMSLWISKLTHAQLPLLADTWTLSSAVKLASDNAISQNAATLSSTTSNNGAAAGAPMYNHKYKRNVCVNDFAELLGLKDSLPINAEWKHYCADRQQHEKPPKRQRRADSLDMLQAGVPGNEVAVLQKLIIHNRNDKNNNHMDDAAPEFESLLGRTVARWVQSRHEWEHWSSAQIQKQVTKRLKERLSQKVKQWQKQFRSEAAEAAETPDNDEEQSAEE
ncbi:hypothetical protein ACA910_021012 [Epithemia clementina (nom. ined.)]